jgi:hypothetical protein
MLRTSFEGDVPNAHVSVKAMLRQLVPGLILPGAIYFLTSRHTSVLVALAAGSSVPLLDALWRILQGKRPTSIGLLFVGFAGVSVALAFGLRSPMFILAKGAAVSGGLGVAFAVSAVVHRPLTRTIALLLFTEHAVSRRRLADRWGHPKAAAVFRTLSFGWGGLLVLSALQQLVMVLSVSPGAVMAAEPAVQAFVTLVGTATSIVYVRRRQRIHPDLGLLPERAR